MKLINWINEIVVIDHDPSQHFLIKELIGEVDKDIPIHGFFGCSEALSFLESTRITKSNFKKSLMFLELNLPDMEGFQFLSHYRTLDAEIKMKYELIILMSSIKPSNKLVIIDFTDLKGFYSKPLDPIILEEILQKLAAESLN
ncbi:MAG: hypothetical protein KGZ81_16270 [Flavobacteriales bacterium]|nr:hypothetical protein [Flavobacteriales bacterium]MBS4042145.1 hypothetical protein [Flavobacteriales bacterium]